MSQLQALLGQPWAVTGELADQAQRLLEAKEGFAAIRRGLEYHASFDVMDAYSRAPGRRAGDVAVIPVLGLLSHRGGVIGSEPTTSTAQIAALARSIAAEPGVSAIVLEVDSPGGEFDGLPEAAAILREVRMNKPLVAVANTIGGSGGYYLLSQAQEVFVTPSARVGSIGVFTAHEDKSAALKAEGRKVTLVSAGKYKVEGNPYEPLAGEARAYIQQAVDEAYAAFVADVARGRGVSRDTVRDSFGQGRMVGAKRAVDLGMASAVGTLEDAIRRATALGVERRRSPAALARAQGALLRQERAALLDEDHGRRGMSIAEAQVLKYRRARG